MIFDTHLSIEVLGNWNVIIIIIIIFDSIFGCVSSLVWTSSICVCVCVSIVQCLDALYYIPIPFFSPQSSMRDELMNPHKLSSRWYGVRYRNACANTHRQSREHHEHRVSQNRFCLLQWRCRREVWPLLDFVLSYIFFFSSVPLFAFRRRPDNGFQLSRARNATRCYECYAL